MNMKKLTLTTIAILAFNIVNAQKIIKIVDSLDDKHYWTADETPVYSDNGTDGFAMRASFKYNEPNPILTGFSVTVGGWGCVEKTEIIVLFEDGDKFKLTSWNKFR